MIRPGVLSAQDAADLNEALRYIRGLRNLSVLPPLRKTPGPDGQNIITIDTSQFLRINPNNVSGGVSGSGSSSEAGPTVVLGTIITGIECINGVTNVTRMDLVATDGFIGLENPRTSLEGCCSCGCACEPTFYSAVRFTFANRTGDLIAAMPDTLDVPLDTFVGCQLSSQITAFGNGAWADQFEINPQVVLDFNSSPYAISFGITGPNVGSMNGGTATDDTGWTSTPSVISRTYAATPACGDVPGSHVGRYSFTPAGGETHPGTGEFDLYFELIP